MTKGVVPEQTVKGAARQAIHNRALQLLTDGTELNEQTLREFHSFAQDLSHRAMLLAKAVKHIPVVAAKHKSIPTKDEVEAAIINPPQGTTTEGGQQ